RARPADLAEWNRPNVGDRARRLFLFPHKRKGRGQPPRGPRNPWMGERVAVPDVERLRRNVRTGEDDVSWGPNNMFRFPLHGGTGAIWKGVAAALPAEKIRFGGDVTAVRLAERIVELRDGRRLPYDALVSSLPLD